MKTSPHLDRIIQRAGAVLMQVVFVDIEKYSRRKLGVRLSVLRSFQDIMLASLREVVSEYSPQLGDEDHLNDVIKLQTGDGVALVFTFSGVNDAHFRFAKTFVRALARRNAETECAAFAEQRWCNCHHDLFYVRVGISDGLGFVFRDMDDDYNAAGPTVDMAARVMDLGNGMQIIMTDGAYRNVVELEVEQDLEKYGKKWANARIKHDLRLDVWQYRPEPADGIDVGDSAMLVGASS